MNSQNVAIGPGAIASISNILQSESAARVFLVVDEAAWHASGAADALAEPFSNTNVTRFSEFDLNPKLKDVQRGLEMLRGTKHDIVIALGGGTAIDLAKLIGAFATQNDTTRHLSTGVARILKPALPVIVIPTTAGTGSEATHFAVVYVDGSKYSVADPNLLPKHVIVDPVLTHSLPPGITAASGLDAFCQAIESIWAVSATKESIAYARKSAELSLQHLATAFKAPTPEAREGMARAAWLSGKAINITKTTAPHALSYTLTSKYGLPHGFAVALTLPSLLSFNASVTAGDCSDPRGSDEVLNRIGIILDVLGAADVDEACDKIEALLDAVNCPRSLGAAGIENKALELMISGVNTERLLNNPRKATPEGLQALLEVAI